MMSEMEEEDDDDDLKLHRASAWAIKEMKEAIAYVVANYGDGSESNKLSPQSDYRLKIKQIIVQLNLFQEDPQLLDPHLKDMLPPLVTTFVKLTRKRCVTQLLKDLGELFYVFCKVRGQKVITRFMDNEPKNLQPMLNFLLEDLQKNREESTESLENPQSSSDIAEYANSPNYSSLTWELRYILMLWVAYLILTPFDLASISESVATVSFSTFQLPEHLPEVAFNVIDVAIRYLASSTKEQSAAATALVKLTLRPDMRQLGILDSLLKWSLSVLSDEGQRHRSIEVMNGSILFLSGFVSTADIVDVIMYLPAIYKAINDIFNSDNAYGDRLRNSAHAKKLSIKIQRHVVAHLLRANKSGSQSSVRISQEMLVDMGALENVIDFFLQSLKDRETLVRYAASKALSVITSQMDLDMAEEVVDAVIESFGEDVYVDGQTKNLKAANASRWHGLTLTLSHMLFRRSPAPRQLPRILDTLYETLKFEQRSTTGSSIGANVRDAANFGLWSLSRRYTTNELLAVMLPPSVSSSPQMSAIQLSACHLVVAACLDSAGNVRRGSSAALQELIGRHPNTVHNGIDLVQIVDYHAVGLRGRAMIDVAVKASNGADIYRYALLDGLFEWRGVQAPDLASRSFAATAIGRLVNLYPNEKTAKWKHDIITKLIHAPASDAEWRSGLIMALGEVISQRAERAEYLGSKGTDLLSEEKELLEDLQEFSCLWVLFEDDGPLSMHKIDLNSHSLRAQLLSSATVSLMTAISTCCLVLDNHTGPESSSHSPGNAATSLFTQCLDTKDPSMLQSLPEACVKIGLVLSQSRRLEIVETWIELYKQRSAQKFFGLLTALASIWVTIPSGNSTDTKATYFADSIIGILLAETSSPNTDIRVLAIRNLVTIIESSSSSSPGISTSNAERILEAFETALDDYTINERGDVGSLVRLEALIAVQHVWKKRLGEQSPRRTLCYRAVHRLALERLDKVRLAAATCLVRISGDENASLPTLPDVSTYAYFMATSLGLLYPNPDHHPISTPKADSTENYITFLLGVSSTAGAGSESLAENARAVLHDIFASLPVHQPPPPPLPRPTATETISPPSTLNTLTNALLPLLTRSLTSDRILLPLLDTLSYLLDSNLLFPLENTTPPPPSLPQTNPPPQLLQPPFKPHTLLSLLQKSHFKSTNPRKLLLAVHVYRGLATSFPTSLRTLVLKKLVSMLGTKGLPGQVRVAVAEALWVVTGDEGVKDVAWGGGVEGNRGVWEGLRGRLCGEG